ncbi:hypothetical protein FGB62_128g029 [Gracilaria domingensis]|nr:hypothetical protein FGB62_128g029 [Gracilaria domingensis]
MTLKSSTTPFGFGGRNEASAAPPNRGTQPSELTKPAAAPSNAQKNQKRSPHSRENAPNYTSDECEILMNCIDEILPLGANEWALVEQRYNTTIRTHDRPTRTAKSLRTKFDNLVKSSKKTGDPTCPQPVRRAKQAERAIFTKMSAALVGDMDISEDDDDYKTSESEHSEISIENRRNQKRKLESVQYVGKRRKKETYSVGEEMRNVNENLKQLNSTLAKPIQIQSPTQTTVTREEVIDIIDAKMKAVSEKMDDMMAILRKLS